MSSILTIDINRTLPTILVGSIREIEGALASNPGRLPVICLRGSRDKGVANSDLANTYAEIVCDDIPRPIGGYVAPNQDVVRQLRIAWINAKQLRSRAVIICCHAGVSRSPAAALGLLYLDAYLAGAGNPLDLAVAELLKARPSCLPNRLLLSLILESTLDKTLATATADSLLRRVAAAQPPIQNPFAP